MNRLLVLAVLAFVLPLAPGCGTNFVIRGALNSQVISGNVGSVQVSFIDNGEVLVTITVVTFVQEGASSTMNFCGDQSSQFVPGDFVQASFTPGTPCNSVLQVSVNGP